MSEPTMLEEIQAVMARPYPDQPTSMTYRAALVADIAHDGVYRKFGIKEPYFRHVERVARYMQSANLPDHVVAAGYLHDVVEDTEITLEDLAEWFPVEVTSLVWAVTRVPGESYTSFILRVKDAGPEAIAIKLADLSDNLATIPLGHKSVKRYTDAIRVLHE